MPFNEAEAVESCRGSGHTHGAPPMTVLVTGAAGFIGHRAATMLRRNGHGALRLSLQLTSVPEKQRKRRTKQFST